MSTDTSPRFPCPGGGQRGATVIGSTSGRTRTRSAWSVLWALPPGRSSVVCERKAVTHDGQTRKAPHAAQAGQTTQAATPAGQTTAPLLPGDGSGGVIHLVVSLV